MAQTRQMVRIPLPKSKIWQKDVVPHQKKKSRKLLHVLVFPMLLGRCWKLETDGLRVPTWSFLWSLAFLVFTRNWTWRMPKTCFLVSPRCQREKKHTKSRTAGLPPNVPRVPFRGFPKFSYYIPGSEASSSSTRVNWGWLLGLVRLKGPVFPTPKMVGSHFKTSIAKDSLRNFTAFFEVGETYSSKTCHFSSRRWNIT